MPLDPANLFGYAKNCVDNKTVLQRIGHSAKLHSVRSAVSSKGSAVSKAASLAGVGIRLVLNQIPVPVVGGVLGALERAVEAKFKSMKHKSNRDNAQSTEDKVKFTLKELSLEELDRFRWKVTDAIKELNKTVAGFQANFDKKSGEGARCDAYFDLAMALMQADRRLDRLKEAVMGIMAALKMTTDWLSTCENGQAPVPPTMPTSAPPIATPQSVNGLREDVRRKIADAIAAETSAAESYANGFPVAERDARKQEYITQRHGKCDRWCCYRSAGKADDWKNFKEKSALVVRTLASVWGPDDFNNNLFLLWKTDGN